MICKLLVSVLPEVLAVINDAAQAYKGAIPADCWKSPYMDMNELQDEVAAGVQLYGWKTDRCLVGVMGIQRVKDVTLIRHAYVRISQQRSGVGKKLLAHLMKIADTPQVLVGTWTAAWWAVRFYEKNGFTAVPQRNPRQTASVLEHT
jgi:GNAT superfamily N-acetyltransferase